MKLDVFFEQLALGELSQHKLGKSGVITLADYPAVISHINRGLTALHSRFPLSHKELTLLQFDNITDYILDTKYSVSAADPTVAEKYIYDTAEKPFLDDLIRIDAAYDGQGCNVPINDEADIRSWFTPNNNTIQIPSPTAGVLVSVMYRANHAKIDRALTDPSLVDLVIPQCLEAALGAFIASRAFIALGNQTSAQLSAFYSQLYESEIKQVKRLNLLQSSQNSSNYKFLLGGWK